MPGLGENTPRFLKSKVFFMDKVQVENVSNQEIQLDLLGPELEAALKVFGINRLLDLGQLQDFQIGLIEGRLIRVSPERPIRYRMIVPTNILESILPCLEKTGIVRLGPVEYNVLRDEAGMPAVGQELKKSLHYSKSD